jgi:hypothetical protein
MMYLDVREILFNWLHRGNYYGYLDEAHSTTEWDEVLYEGSEDRMSAWLEIAWALGRMSAHYRGMLHEYLNHHGDKPLVEWDYLPVSLWVAVTEALSDIVIREMEEIENDRCRR